jgi:hypothetical protein
VPCLPEFRSNVPSSIPPAGMARRTAHYAVVMSVAELVRRVLGVGPSGRGQFARVILTGS